MLAKRALLSVSDKTGVRELASTLVQAGFELWATGGTAAYLRSEELQVTELSELTGIGPLLGGRLKTLHPAVLAGILARDTEEDMRELRELGFHPFDLVVVNFYPFAEAARHDRRHQDLVEFIDIGGPTMIRAAAKNYQRVAVVVDPKDYPAVGDELRQTGKLSLDTRKRLMVKAFALTAHYDALVTAAFQEGMSALPDVFLLAGSKTQELRYGENPHQSAAAYELLDQGGIGLLRAELHQGKVLSYNNLSDADAALWAVSEFREPAVVIVKHANPCGVGLDSSSPLVAYRRALSCDPMSAFGGIAAVNRPVEEELAQEIVGHFFEVVLAPGYSAQSLKALKKRKNLRVLELSRWWPSPDEPRLVVRNLLGGFLVQEADGPVESPRAGTVVTKVSPKGDDWEALELAWKVAKHVKSNAIVIAKSQMTLGIGAGQMSRVDAAQLAVRKAVQAGHDLGGAAAASDAFFPFPDGLEALAQAGIRAVVQPGGSIRDRQVVEAADRLGVAMVFTGRRHFRH